MNTIRLTTQDQERFLESQRVLLSPFAAPDLGEWQLRANRAVRAFVAADHSIFSLPVDRKAFPTQVTEDTDPDLSDRIRDYVQAGPGPYYRSPDPYLEKVHRARVDAGAGAYHLDDLVSREEQASSSSLNDLFFPAGLNAMAGISLPLSGGGEATQFFGFAARQYAEGRDRTRRRLSLLVPAFACGVRAVLRRRHHTWQLSANLDRVEQPVAVYREGRLLHRNHALEAVLLDAPGSERIARAMDDLAREFHRRSSGPRRTQDPPSTRVERQVRTDGGVFRLWAVYAPGPESERERVLVQLERAGPRLPDAGALEGRHGLTAREATVALLLAEGHSDKAIARRLDISWHTARVHSRNVLAKLGLSSRAKVALALLRPDDTA